MADEESQRIHGLSRRNMMRAGILGLGAAAAGVAAPLLTAGVAQALSNQTSWAVCDYCAGLWYFNLKQLPASYCANPHAYKVSYGEHYASTSFNYELLYPVDSGTNPQQDWRWCNKCDVLFYSVNQSFSICPAGGQHDSTGSYHYGLNYYTSYPNDEPQGGWRWCTYCQGLFVTASGVTSYCPALGYGHIAGDGSYDYGITWSGTLKNVPQTPSS
jgi:hypothetical protein